MIINQSTPKKQTKPINDQKKGAKQHTQKKLNQSTKANPFWSNKKLFLPSWASRIGANQQSNNLRAGAVTGEAKRKKREKTEEVLTSLQKKMVCWGECLFLVCWFGWENSEDCNCWVLLLDLWGFLLSCVEVFWTIWLIASAFPDELVTEESSRCGSFLPLAFAWRCHCPFGCRWGSSKLGEYDMLFKKHVKALGHSCTNDFMSILSLCWTNSKIERT